MQTIATTQRHACTYKHTASLRLLILNNQICLVLKIRDKDFVQTVFVSS